MRSAGFSLGFLTIRRRIHLLAKEKELNFTVATAL
jgi:hypothetical protein